MIDVWSEDLLDLQAATKSRPFLRNGHPINIATLFRYTSRGARARNGDRVRLEVVKTPSGLRTSQQAIQRFIERLNADDASTVTPSEIATDHVRAEAALAGQGM